MSQSDSRTRRNTPPPHHDQPQDRVRPGHQLVDLADAMTRARLREMDTRDDTVINYYDGFDDDDEDQEEEELFMALLNEERAMDPVLRRVQ